MSLIENVLCILFQSFVKFWLMEVSIDFLIIPGVQNVQAPKSVKMVVRNFGDYNCSKKSASLRIYYFFTFAEGHQCDAP